jgi:hypothetical protein
MQRNSQKKKDRTANNASAKKLLLLLCGYHSLGAGDAHSISKVLAIGSHKAEAVCAEPQGKNVYSEVILYM